jgi:RNA polymerase sigma factor (TIGR02999 family)
MQRERAGHTLQPTALVNELFLKLIGGAAVEWQDRAHFLAVASQQLRRILVDYARERRAEKRGGEWHATTLVEQPAVARPFEEDLLDLHQALDELSALDPRALK